MTDSQLLEWVRLRARGHSAAQIARTYGVISARVRTVTNRIKLADKAESGSDYDQKAYWPD